MKKFLLTLSLVVLSLAVHAQEEVTIKAGISIPFQSINTVRAADVSEGDNLPFRVSRDVIVNGKIAIPYGTIVKATVSKAKKSSWWGTRGRLAGSITEIVMEDGTIIPIENGNFEIKGQNRTALSVILFCFVTMPACLITGSRAEMPAGYELVGNVASNVTVKVY